jgi:hypothetical protein
MTSGQHMQCAPSALCSWSGASGAGGISRGLVAYLLNCRVFHMNMHAALSRQLQPPQRYCTTTLLQYVCHAHAAHSVHAIMVKHSTGDACTGPLHAEFKPFMDLCVHLYAGMQRLTWCLYVVSWVLALWLTLP